MAGNDSIPVTSQSSNFRLEKEQQKLRKKLRFIEELGRLPRDELNPDQIEKLEERKDCEENIVKVEKAIDEKMTKEKKEQELRDTELLRHLNDIDEKNAKKKRGGRSKKMNLSKGRK